MEDKRIIVLQELLQATDQKNFDFEAWKIKASIVLKMIFGADDEKINLIKQLHYDYSSWSLRDHSGGKQHDSVKDQACEIIETAIVELKMSESGTEISDLFKKQLTGAEFDELQGLLNLNAINEEQMIEYFSKIAPSKKDLILSQILLKLK